MILIIDSVSIKDKAEDNINIESNYHLQCISLIVLLFQYENNINTTNDVMHVMGKSANASAHGDTCQC